MSKVKVALWGLPLLMLGWAIFSFCHNISEPQKRYKFNRDLAREYSESSPEAAFYYAKEALNTQDVIERHHREKTLTFTIVILFLFVLSETALYYLYKISRRNSSDEIKIAVLENERQKLQAATSSLDETISTKNKFFSIVAHELKNPLSIILLTAEFIETNYDEFEPEEIRQSVSNVREAAQRISHLLNNLLDWSRQQGQTISYQPQTIYLDRIADEITQLFKPNATVKSIKLINSVTGSIPIFADKNMVTAVVRNLVSNAVKFTPNGGKIELSTQEDGAWVTICVQDTGVGMDEDRLKNIFNSGNNVSSSGTMGETGTGLGLNLCLDFALKNDGKIWATSEKGKGSSFYLKLPKDDSFHNLVKNLKSTL